MTFRPELIDELLKDYQCPDDLMGEGGIFKQLTKALVERCLSAELAHHLTEEKAEAEVVSSKNRRNGTSKKTIKGAFGEAAIGIPRDRNGSFEPQLIEKGQTRFTGFGWRDPIAYADSTIVPAHIPAVLRRFLAIKIPTHGALRFANDTLRRVNCFVEISTPQHLSCGGCWLGCSVH
jgi:putative transposase